MSAGMADASGKNCAQTKSGAPDRPAHLIAVVLFDHA
jgi:hypothetical protein